MLTTFVAIDERPAGSGHCRCTGALSQGENMFKDRFISALHEKRKIRLTFYSKEDAGVVVRICAPMDYGPSRRAKQKNDRYHLWNYESDTGQHVLSVSPEQVQEMAVLDEHFEPGEFVTWSTAASSWFIKRDWGPYS